MQRQNKSLTSFQLDYLLLTSPLGEVWELPQRLACSCENQKLTERAENSPMSSINTSVREGRGLTAVGEEGAGGEFDSCNDIQEHAYLFIRSSSILEQPQTYRTGSYLLLTQ